MPDAALGQADPGVLAAGTVVRIRTLQAVGSRLSQSGERFAIELAHPIPVPGGAPVPAGVRGEAQVVHAAKARAGGKAGELILAARFLEHDGVRIPLRSLHMSSKGKDNTALATGVAIGAGVAAFLIAGGNVEVPAGTEADARVSTAVLLPPALNRSTP